MTVAPYTLTYAAPAECPAEEEFRRDVAGRVPAESLRAEVHVDVVVEAADGRYHGTVTALDGAASESTRRLIDGDSCAEVAHALAFLAALLVELNGHLDADAEPPPPPVSPPPAPAPPSAVAVAAPVRRAPVSPANDVRVSAVLLGAGRPGFGPSVLASGEAGVDVVVGAGTVAPSARLVAFAGRGSLSALAGSASLWFAGARLELCPIRLGLTTLAFRVCAGAELGAVHAQGDVLFEPRAVTEPWITAETTLRVSWFPFAFATRSFFVELGGGPVLPLDRTRYYLEPDATLYRTPVASARLATGLGWQF